MTPEIVRTARDDAEIMAVRHEHTAKMPNSPTSSRNSSRIIGAGRDIERRAGSSAITRRGAQASAAASAGAGAGHPRTDAD